MAQAGANQFAVGKTTEPEPEYIVLAMEDLTGKESG